MIWISKRFIWQCALFSIVFFNANVFAAIDDSSAKIKWGYKGNTGPTYWAKLDPHFATCMTGKTQSPISIPAKIKTTAPNSLVIDYHEAPIVIMNNGTTDLMIGETQTIINDGHSVQLNFPSNEANESITLNDKKYHLIQFHFHSPSENMLHRESFPLEIHFVHQSDNGELAVIGVFVEDGVPNSNPELQKIIDHLPLKQGEAYQVEGAQINPINLLPAKRNYYRFNGSLTTPPCTEGVLWIVMAQPISASSAQIVRLRREMGGMNARPIQSLNGRPIYYVND